MSDKIKNTLNATDEVTDNIEKAADKLESVTTVTLPEPTPTENSVEENDGVTVSDADANETNDLPPDEEPKVEKDIDGEKKKSAEETIASLHSEIAALKEQIAKLEALKQTEARILAEIGDFCALFPDVPVEELPDEVWESVRAGAPLAASYALYERKKCEKIKRIAAINAKNVARSPGAAGTDTASEFFTPDEVRRMSRAEVHANYSKIKESMKKWMQK